MGAVALRDSALAERLRYLQNALGAVPSPFDCYLVHRGLKTLALRMEQHCENAMKIAQWLERRAQTEPKCIHRVLYPGLESHPQHETAKRNAARPNAFGGMVVFSVDNAAECLPRMRLSALAESLGGVESLIELPALMTHQSVPKTDRERLGIDERLVRWSVGIEDVGDLLSDLENALHAVQSQRIDAGAITSTRRRQGFRQRAVIVTRAAPGLQRLGWLSANSSPRLSRVDITPEKYKKLVDMAKKTDGNFSAVAGAILESYLTAATNRNVQAVIFDMDGVLV
ncbi:hypothetical protein F1559_004433 [Cyanidiococcus yangmingshanensis]|uniref:cystathionine gamma-lyase n=1 Tax=Cyanidiococcus yangmingshanensis TaxID=2690220 RepID=A0A7J7IQD8_9RHOD|nr:hypothetical protein F1559_004433 [Cyanidiococcus yangmingshanensis]